MFELGEGEKQKQKQKERILGGDVGGRRQGERRGVQAGAGLEDQPDVVGVLLGVPGENLNIVQIDDNKVVNKIPKQVIYQCLEDGGGVRQAERHDEVFKVPQVGVEARLPFVPLWDMDQMVCIAQVQFGENCGMRDGLKGGAKEW